MLKLTIKDIQRTLWSLSDAARSSLEVSDGAFLITAFWTLKVLLDNKEYFQITDVGDWRTILEPGEDVSQRIRGVIQAIEQQVPHLAGVFSKMDLSEIDFKILYRFVQELDLLDMAYESAQDPSPLNGTIALAADTWFERVADMAGRGSEFWTPNQIRELCARLLKVSGGTVYDGTAGIAGMLVEAAREALRNGASIPKLFGQEVNVQTWGTAQMNLILHGISLAKVAQGDVLKDPVWTEENRRLMRFDYVLMNPPFALRFPNKEQFEGDRFGRYQYGTPSAAFADMAFVQHAIASMTEAGKAVLVQPHGALFRSGIDAKIRAGILDDHLIEAVVFLPRNLLLNTGIPVALLILNRQNPHPGQVLLIKADEEFQPGRIQNVLRSEDLDKICDTYHNAREIDGYSRLIQIEEIAENEWNLNYTRYFDFGIVDSKVGQVQVSLQTFSNASTPIARLSDIAEIERGYGVPKDAETDEEEATHRLINLGDVDEEGIHVDKTTPIGGDLRKLRFYELTPGDVILSSRGTALKVAVVPDTDERLVASANFIVLRLRKGFDPYFVKAFLESPVGIQQLQAHQRGSAVPVLSHKDVRDILIPNLPLDTQQRIAEASRNAEQELLDAKRETERRYQQRYREVYQMMGIDLAFEDTDEGR